MNTLLPVTQELRDYMRLALLEADRGAQEGRTAEAWELYRACRRSGIQLGRNGCLIQRLVAAAIEAGTLEPALRWEARPDVKEADLKKALDEVLADDERRPADSMAFKYEYIGALHNGEQVAAASPALDALARFTAAGEAMKRKRKLLFANWLSQVDKPRWVRTPLRQLGRLELFELDPKAPADPQLVAPELIASSYDFNFMEPLFRQLYDVSFFGCRSALTAFDRERARMQLLRTGLALELYKRRHGRFPDRLDELVKSGELKELPADAFGQGQPLGYRRAPKGTHLWTVWSDSVDDGGTPQANADRVDSPGDYVIELEGAAR
jgi:hypothetical protein